MSALLAGVSALYLACLAWSWWSAARSAQSAEYRWIADVLIDEIERAPVVEAAHD